MNHMWYASFHMGFLFLRTRDRHLRQLCFKCEKHRIYILKDTSSCDAHVLNCDSHLKCMWFTLRSVYIECKNLEITCETMLIKSAFSINFKIHKYTCTFTCVPHVSFTCGTCASHVIFIWFSWKDPNTLFSFVTS